MESNQFPVAQQPHYLQPVTIRELCVDRHRFNIDPPFQRKKAWRLPQCQQMIETILRGQSIGTLEGYREKEASEDGTVYGIVDGHQRITAILEFVDNRIKTWTEKRKRMVLPNSQPPVEPGKFFKDLSKVARNNILDYRVYINIIPRMSDLEMVERFLGIQCQTPLSAAERLYVYPSKAKDAARCLAAHPFWEQFYVGERNRGQLFQSSLYLLAIELAGGPVDLGRSAWFSELASGRHDQRVTDAPVQRIHARLDEMACFYAGMQFSDRAISIVMYQSVLFLCQAGYHVTPADRGKLTPWITTIIAESKRVTGAPAYHQPTNHLVYASAQRAFWEKHRTTVMRLFGIAERESNVSHFDSRS